VDLANWMGWQDLEDRGEPSCWVNFVESTVSDEGVDYCGISSSLMGSGKEVVFTFYSNRSHLSFKGWTAIRRAAAWAIPYIGLAAGRLVPIVWGCEKFAEKATDFVVD
jgi:hypothetical protein